MTSMNKKRTAKDDREIFDIPEDARPARRSPAKRGERQSANGAADPRRAAAKPRGERRGAKAAPERANGRHRVPSTSGAKPARRGKGPAKPKKAARLADIRDDVFLEEWDAPAPRRKKERKRRKNQRASRITVAVNMMLLTCMAAVFMMAGLVVYRHNVFLEMKQAVEAQTFYEGTTVEGVDVSDMTLAAAMDYWQNRIEPGYSGRTVRLDDATAITAAELGYKSDYESVLANAWSAGRRGSLEQRYRAVVHREAHPVAYDVDRTLYSNQLLDSYVRAMAAKIDKPAVDAKIDSFDMNTYAFVFTDSEEGRKLDAEGLRQQIAEGLESGGGTANVVVETLEPSVTKDEVANRYGMVASAVTNASSSSSNRLKNIERAMSFINGICLKPGQEFSFNGIVGKRTTDRGFRVAAAYSSGTVTEEVGGGICQVSTTLFNCAVKADLEITERHNHSLTVGYVDKGKDATVNWNSQDLKFRNTSDDDIYICCMLTKDKRVRFGIFGKLLENGETITVEAVTTKTIKYDTQYQANPLLPPGQTKVVEAGKNGFKAEAYKVRWDADGNQISKELLCKSVYKARDQVVQVGPS